MARHSVGEGARHPQRTDRQTGSLFRARRHVAVRSAAPGRPRPHDVLQGARGTSDPRRSGNAGPWSRAMTTSAVSGLRPDRQPGKPPLLRLESAVDRQAIRAFVAEHGSLLIRGLGLHDAADAERVFRQLGRLMTEREAFAPRERYAQGVYSASKWPPNQQMCMHHELSYALAVPNLMLFACVVPSASGG